MALQRLNTSLGLIIPQLDVLVITRGNEIGFIGSVVVVDVIDALVVGFEGVICGGGGKGPDFDGAVETGRGECVGVFGVYGEGHDVVGVAFEDAGAFPVLVPVPEFDGHVVRAGQHERLRGMDRDAADITVVRMLCEDTDTLDELRNS